MRKQPGPRHGPAGLGGSVGCAGARGCKARGQSVRRMLLFHVSLPDDPLGLQPVLPVIAVLAAALLPEVIGFPGDLLLARTRRCRLGAGRRLGGRRRRQAGRRSGRSFLSSQCHHASPSQSSAARPGPVGRGAEHLASCQVAHLATPVKSSCYKIRGLPARAQAERTCVQTV